MSDTIRYEVHLALLSLWTGAGLMVVYDLLRFFRVVIPHNGSWIVIEDVGYWLYSAFMTFGLLYEQNGGELRACVVFQVFLGMFLYQNFISRNLLKYLKNRWRYLKMNLRKHRNR